MCLKDHELAASLVPQLSALQPERSATGQTAAGHGGWQTIDK